MDDLPNLVELDCPVCDEAMEFSLKRKVWFGMCSNCMTRIYTPIPAMNAVLKEMRHAAKGEKVGTPA